MKHFIIALALCGLATSAGCTPAQTQQIEEISTNKAIDFAGRCVGGSLLRCADKRVMEAAAPGEDNRFAAYGECLLQEGFDCTWKTALGYAFEIGTVALTPSAHVSGTTLVTRAGGAEQCSRIAAAQCVREKVLLCEAEVRALAGTATAKDCIAAKVTACMNAACGSEAGAGLFGKGD